MLYDISGKLRATIDQLRSKDKKMAQQALSELKDKLIDSDVSHKAADKFIELTNYNKTDDNTWLEALHNSLRELLSPSGTTSELNLRTKKPAVILMAGIQGAGKTTSTAKLAVKLQSKKQKVLVASTDIYRPAAMEQLQILLEPFNITTEIQEHQESALAIAEKALTKAKSQNYDILIIDTAGRQHDQLELMQEIKSIRNHTQPIETLLVVDGMAGNFAVESAKAFLEHINLTGFILTKMDGNQKGGAAISIAEETELPIKFIGRGEQINKLENFDVDRFVKIILDMGDETGFIEQLQNIDTKKQQKMANELKKGKWDFNQFLEQLEQIQNMGGARELLSKMPGANKIMSNQGLLEQGEKNLQTTKAMIQSMTKKERENPLLLENNSRRRRIVAGSGSDIRSFNMMLKQFKQMQKVMSSLKGKGMAQLMKKLQNNQGLD